MTLNSKAMNRAPMTTLASHQRYSAALSQSLNRSYGSFGVPNPAQKYRCSSIYDTNVKLQLHKEQQFKLREMELKRKFDSMDPEKFKELSNAVALKAQERDGHSF